MARSIAAFLAVCVFLWVLPLGNLIKPSQEKMACGGGRAMHMCTMGMGKVRTESNSSSKISFTNASGVEKTNKPSAGSAGTDLSDLDVLVASSQIRSKFLTQQSILLNQTFVLTLDPVPKI